ncbi:MAG: hypothetical protein M1829_005262 [Trizodia sp. TS-e1964]|nr:MAG: hypothetical protein M1829_005262 [Trizodia sp. TS-e1964]
MSTAVYPPISRSQLRLEEQASIAKELEWLLNSLQDTLASIKAGLQECMALLAPREPGSTLVLSSLRSECVKGFVTRVGTRIVKGDAQIKMLGLSPTKGSNSYRLAFAPNSPFILPQLRDMLTLINQSLDVVDVSTWTGDGQDGNFITGQLRLLSDNFQEARQVLKGVSERPRLWNENPIDPVLFDPPLPDNLSVDFSVSDAAIRLELRTLETAAPPADALSAINFRERFAVAIGAAKKPDHDEVYEVFTYKGEKVRVKEKIRVESQDPSLMALMAKLAALEHNVSLSRKALDLVMGKDE